MKVIKLGPSPQKLAADARVKALGLKVPDLNFDHPIRREDLRAAMAEVTRRETLISPADWPED